MDTSTSFLTLALFAVAAGLWYWVTRAEGTDPGEGGHERFVEIFRCDMGQGYTDSDLLDMIGFLGSRGIHATYDVAYAAAEVFTIKTYSLKVLPEEVEEAKDALRQWREQDAVAGGD